MASKKNLLSISDPSVNRTKFGDFTRNYRQSSNVIDRRDNRGDFRAISDMSGRTGVDSTRMREFYEDGARGKTRVSDTSTTRSSNRSISAPDENTPDDYSTTDIGAKMSQTTPSNTRKVTAEEAVRKTHFERN